MARIFRNKQFSSYLGENRAILDIVTQYTTGTTPTPPVVYPFNIGRGYDQKMDAIIQVGNYYYVSGRGDFYNLSSINHMNQISKTTGANQSSFSTFFGSGFTQDGIAPVIECLIEQPDGQLIIGGAWDFGSYFPAGNAHIARINSDGSLDPSFTGTSTTSINNIVYGSDNKLYVSRFSSSPISYNLDGSVNTSFVVGINSQIRSMIELSSGDLLIGGSFTNVNGTTIPRIAKINKNGVVDATFDANVGSGPSSTVFDMVEGTDGGIYLVGLFGNYNGVSANRIVKINPDGTRDSSFNMGTGFSGTNPPGGAYKILFDVNRVIVLTDETQSSYNGTTFYGNMIALNLDGTIDNTFGDITTLGYGFTNVQPGQVNAQEAIIDSDGNLVVVGEFTVFSGKNYSRIIKINPNGEAITSIV
jgi:hypothetical protein